MTADPTEIATFAAVAVTLYAGHLVGDHWIQTDHQAETKDQPGKPGRLAAAEHVATLTATQAAFLALVAWVLALPLTVLGLVLGLGVNAATHYWADRRVTLKALADRVGKGKLWTLGEPVGGGAYALDMSWHVGWIVPAALLIAAV
ncbi:MAG: transcriptional regulator [Streptomycetaceae bacterium]|nr:transcriptional regulator [Streptomycetaceae bacterium]